jgi:hypothetical protein
MNGKRLQRKKVELSECIVFSSETSTLCSSRDGILGHQSNKRLESFAPCYSQSLLLADFNENQWSSLVLKILLKNQGNKKTRLYSIHELHFVERKMGVENQTKT